MIVTDLFPNLANNLCPLEAFIIPVGNKVLDTKLSEKLQRVIRKKKLDLNYLLKKFSMIFVRMKES